MADALDQLLAAQAGATSGAPAGGGDALDNLLAAQAKTTAFAAPDPTDGMSTMDKLLAGTGMGMAKIGRAVGQAMGAGIDAIAPAPQRKLSDLVTGVAPQTLSERLGFPTQASIDEANRLDAALAKTTPGKIGSFAGQTAAVLPAALIPGANTYLGATAIGAGVGGLTTEGGLKERAIGAGLGALGGGAAKGLGDLAGYGLGVLDARRVAAQVANAGRDTAASAARGAGYVIPPADTNPTLLNEMLNGLSGKIKTAQSASAKNQAVTNDLARTAIGAPTDTPLSSAALNGIRNKAAQAYDAVGRTGTIVPGKPYSDALDNIAAPFVKASQGFPNAKPSPVLAEIDSLRSPQFDAASAVAKIRSLRADADAVYRAGNADLGKALKGGANALEDAIDTHLTSIGAPSDLLDNFRNARQLIAKTYSVQKGLNDVTGDVSAQALGNQLAKGKPLSGDLLTIAQTNAAFPKATQTLKEAPKQLSPLDFMGGLMAAASTGHPAAALLPIARPAVRAGLLSGPYQRILGAPTYAPGVMQELLGGALAAPMVRQAAPAEMGLLTSRFAEH